MSATLMQDPRLRFFDNNGKPLVGGKLYTCIPGGTVNNLKTTYSDLALTAANANPIILDSAGYAPSIYVGSIYKIFLYDADNVLLLTQDNVNGVNTNTSTSSDQITPQMYGAVGDGVADDTAAIQTTLSQGGKIYFPPGTYIVNNIGAASAAVFSLVSNTEIYGNYPNSIIKIRDNPNNYFSILGKNDTSTNVNVHDMTFDHNIENDSTAPTIGASGSKATCHLAGAKIAFNHNLIKNQDCISSVSFNSVGILDGEIQNNTWLNIGTNTQHVLHDSSLIYVHPGASATVLIKGNKATGSTDGYLYGANAFIETHGSHIITEGNECVGFRIGANLTGVAAQSSEMQLCTGNNFDTVLSGITLWSQNVAGQVSGYGIDGLKVTNNFLRIRNTTHNFSSVPASSNGILFYSTEAFGTVNHFSDNGAGGTTVTKTSGTVPLNGTYIHIQYSTNYNGDHQIFNRTASTFDIPVAFQGDDSPVGAPFIQWDYAIGLDMRNVEISGNTLQYDEQNIGSYPSIYTDVSSDGGICTTFSPVPNNGTLNMEDVKITNNTIINCPKAGIRLFFGDWKNLHVTGNTLINCGQSLDTTGGKGAKYPILINVNSVSGEFIVRDNTIVDTFTPAPRIPGAAYIKVLTDCSTVPVTIANNNMHITGDPATVILTGITSSITFSEADNTIKDTNGGLAGLVAGDQITTNDSLNIGAFQVVSDSTADTIQLVSWATVVDSNPATPVVITCPRYPTPLTLADDNIIPFLDANVVNGTTISSMPGASRAQSKSNMFDIGTGVRYKVKDDGSWIIDTGSVVTSSITSNTPDVSGVTALETTASVGSPRTITGFSGGIVGQLVIMHFHDAYTTITMGSVFLGNGYGGAGAVNYTGGIADVALFTCSAIVGGNSIWEVKIFRTADKITGHPDTQGDLTSSRLIGTVYTNGTGNPMFVAVTIQDPTSPPLLEALVGPPSATVSVSQIGGTTAGTVPVSTFFVVPAGYQYWVRVVSGTGQLIKWTEWH